VKNKKSAAPLVFPLGDFLWWPLKYTSRAEDNESAVYQPRDAWDACFCPRCNVKSPRLVLVLGGAS
jgi:hypothetical protein